MNWTQSVSVDVGKILSTFASKNTGRAVGGVIDLVAKGSVSRSKSAFSTSIPTASLPSIYPASAPLGTGIVGPTSISRSPSKLAHILLPQLALESEEEEGSEGDELPTFHRGSIGSRTKKRATIVRPAPLPFPMQLASESPVSPRASRLRGRDGASRDDGDVVEIVDVFMTPRGPSPPRSPTPSPSPVKSSSVHASPGPATFVELERSSGFPSSPTKSKPLIDVEPNKKTKQRRHVSSDWDTHVSGSERKGIPKSPRKSEAHSSPRHVHRVRGRASSPTPLGLASNSHTNNVALWTSDAEGRNASDGRRPQPENSGSTQMANCVGQKPRQSDVSAIYISSGSEDEGSVGLGADNGQGDGEAEANEDQDDSTDRDGDVWADTGMILSAPPSSARFAPPISGDLVPPAPAVEVVLPNPARASKFKPARAEPSSVDVHTLASDIITSANPKGTTGNGDIVVPRPVCRAPLLVARAKRSKGRDDDVIDLTSD